MSSGPKPRTRFLLVGACIGAILFTGGRQLLALYLSGAAVISGPVTASVLLSGTGGNVSYSAGINKQGGIADTGTLIGQFVSRECKHGGWKWTGTEREVAQQNWAALIVSHGGDASFVSHA